MTVGSTVYLGVSVVVASVVSSLYLDREVLRDLPSPTFQPRPLAFSIWSVVFATGVLRAILQWIYRNGPDDVQTVSLVLHATSFLFCAIWAPTFSNGFVRTASVVLGVACVLAYLSVVLSNVGLDDWSMVLVHSGADLLAGWLSVAFLLSIVLASWAPDATSLLLVGSALVTSIAVLLSRPFMLIPLLWACLFQHHFDVHVRWTLVLVCLGLLASSITRDQIVRHA